MKVQPNDVQVPAMWIGLGRIQNSELFSTLVTEALALGSTDVAGLHSFADLGPFGDPRPSRFSDLVAKYPTSGPAAAVPGAIAGDGPADLPVGQLSSWLGYGNLQQPSQSAQADGTGSPSGVDPRQSAASWAREAGHSISPEVGLAKPAAPSAELVPLDRQAEGSVQPKALPLLAAYAIGLSGSAPEDYQTSIERQASLGSVSQDPIEHQWVPLRLTLNQDNEKVSVIIGMPALSGDHIDTLAKVTEETLTHLAVELGSLTINGRRSSKRPA